MIYTSASGDVIYKNKVDDRAYIFTDKIGGKSDKIAQIQALVSMDDYPRDQHIMWLVANNYLTAI